jgi:hypothetical protein
MKTQNHGDKHGGWPGLLALVFIHLKLSGSIDWSWWLVLSPMIIATAVHVAVNVYAEMRDTK